MRTPRCSKERDDGSAIERQSAGPISPNPSNSSTTASSAALFAASRSTTVEDWRRPFTEFARILRSGGFLVFSAQHPVDEYIAFEVENYFEIEQERMTWSAGGKEIDVPFYRRPFSEVINPLVETGFELDEPVEPTPNETFEDEKPESYEKRSTYPTFICVRASIPE